MSYTNWQKVVEGGLFHFLPSGLGPSIAFAIVVLSVTCIAIITSYRLFFSALSEFPGPKIAAVTGYYEFYYDFFRKGTYVFEIEKMHERYGTENGDRKL